MTTKIFDNTVISASLKEITSIELIKKCLKRYQIATSIEVFEETKNGFENLDIENCYKQIKIFDLRKNKLYSTLINYLSNRYPYLHRGELSSFLVALTEYEMKNRGYYFVTDDNKMRTTIPKILKDQQFIFKINKDIRNFKITGTIGLIKQLCHRNIITKAEIEKVIEDLKNSAFRITPELLNNLKKC